MNKQNPKFNTSNWHKVYVPMAGNFWLMNCIPRHQFLINANLQVVLRSGTTTDVRIIAECEKDLERVSLRFAGNYFAAKDASPDVLPCRLDMDIWIEQRSKFDGGVQIELTTSDLSHDLGISGAVELIVQDLQGDSLALTMDEMTQAMFLDCSTQRLDLDAKGNAQVYVRDLRSTDIRIDAYGSSYVEVPEHRILSRVNCHDEATAAGAGDPEFVANYLTGQLMSR